MTIKQDLSRLMQEDEHSAKIYELEVKHPEWSHEEIKMIINQYGPYAQQILNSLENHSYIPYLVRDPKYQKPLLGLQNRINWLTPQEALEYFSQTNHSTEDIAAMVGQETSTVATEIEMYNPENVISNLEQYRHSNETENVFDMEPQQAEQEQEPQQEFNGPIQIASAYNAICESSGYTQANQKDLSLQNLLDTGMITAEDIQKVCDAHPEIISQIGGGPTLSKLAKSADQVTSLKSEGKCHTGVFSIYARAGNDSISNAAARKATQSYRKPYQGTFNGGCSAAAALDASGKCISLTVKNAAYNGNFNSSANQTMNALFYSVQPGVTFCIDSIEDDKVRKAKGDTAGGKYGHDCVMRSDGKYASDFIQKTINFSRYGAYAHASYPTDARVPEEYVKLILEQAQMRTGEYINAENIEKHKQLTAEKQKANTSMTKLAAATEKRAQRANLRTPQSRKATPRKKTAVRKRTTAHKTVKKSVQRTAVRKPMSRATRSR
ncbi:hypothetical protein IJ556_02425 [bacterium]|nr:hypothetical protein [bacterium]MBR2273287.1 hypothetical protein [Alphaproteobacteria bacterium]